VKTPHPARSCSGIALNGCGLFVLPFLVGGAASLFFESSEVVETGDAMLILALIFILPPLVVQMMGVFIKVARERLFLKEAGRLTTGETLASIHRHMRIVTPRGWIALGTGLWFVVLSLGAKWASLGMLAVLSLLLFYVVLGATSFLSTFQVRTFERGLGRGVAGIRRELSPAVVLAGQVAEERVHLTKVPVPAGFTLLIEDPNTPELQTESRYAVGAGAKRKGVTLSGTFRKTPRGLHRLGPARIWYQDALGFTRVSVASMATAELKVLPRFVPLTILEPPRSRLEAPDVLTKPHRFATEDHFRFKEYSAGDDTRRIHWRLSIRTGRLQVRLPETKETSTRQVVLVLDTFLPKGRMLEDAVGMGRILDALVEAWISLADELVDRGDQVTLVAAVDDGRGNTRVERLSCRGESRRWQDLGARARWQGDHDLGRVIGTLGGEVHGVAVSSRFFPPPDERSLGGSSFTWVYLPPGESLGPPEPPFWKVWAGGGDKAGRAFFLRFFRLPGPPGSDENGVVRQFTDTRRAWRAYQARARLRRVSMRRGAATKKALIESGATVYVLEPGEGGHVLRGVSAGTGSVG
jgi:uncharacterized protein (DUF58 family)